MAEETSQSGSNELKASWRPKFQSEYSMGELDFMRYNETLKNIDLLSARVHSTFTPELELMQNFFSELINLYDDFRPLISNGIIMKEFDDLIANGVIKKRKWERSMKANMPINKVIIFEFVDLCRMLKTKLYSIKQVLGLGIQVKRMMTTAEKIKRGIRGDNNFDRLPEA